MSEVNPGSTHFKSSRSIELASTLPYSAKFSVALSRAKRLVAADSVHRAPTEGPCNFAKNIVQDRRCFAPTDPSKKHTLPTLAYMYSNESPRVSHQNKILDF